MKTSAELEAEMIRLLAISGRVSAEQESISNRQHGILDEIANVQAELKALEICSAGNRPVSPLLVASEAPKAQPVKTEPTDAELKAQVEALMAENAKLRVRKDNMGRPRKYNLEEMFPNAKDCREWSLPENEAEAKRVRACIANAKNTYLKGKGWDFMTRTIIKGGASKFMVMRII